MDKIIVVNSETCLGCHSCEIACAVEHSRSKSLLEAIYEENPSFPRIILEEFGDGTIPIHCRHCEDAPCITVCPTQAISRPAEDSPVVLHKDQCIGCHACIIVCPFGVIKRGSDGRSLIKCDLCIARLNDGDEPACVEACPTHTIKFLSIEEITSKKRKEYVGKYKVAIQAGVTAIED